MSSHILELLTISKAFINKYIINNKDNFVIIEGQKLYADDFLNKIKDIEIGSPYPYGTEISIDHDGFQGKVIGHYITLQNKRGVVLQQNGTKVVHVYGEKWCNLT